MPKKKTKLRAKPGAKPRQPQVKVDNPPVLINEKADRQTVQVQMRGVVQIKHKCPGCKIDIRVMAPDKVAFALKGGMLVGVQCEGCGQPMTLEYHEEKPEPRRIVTPEHDLVLRSRGM